MFAGWVAALSSASNSRRRWEYGMRCTHICHHAGIASCRRPRDCREVPEPCRRPGVSREMLCRADVRRLWRRRHITPRMLRRTCCVSTMVCRHQITLNSWKLLRLRESRDKRMRLDTDLYTYSFPTLCLPSLPRTFISPTDASLETLSPYVLI